MVTLEMSNPKDSASQPGTGWEQLDSVASEVFSNPMFSDHI